MREIVVAGLKLVACAAVLSGSVALLVYADGMDKSGAVGAFSLIFFILTGIIGIVTSMFAGLRALD